MSNLATIVNNILADSGIDDINVVVTNGSYSNPAWITALAWTKITGTPTTLGGYGITDAVKSSRTITINGLAQDLSANRSWTIDPGVVDIIAGDGISAVGTADVVITNTGVLSVNGSTGNVTGIATTAQLANYALLNGNTSVSFGVFELTYAATVFNPSLGPRLGLNPMSIKMWNNYFNGTGLGSDYGTVMEYYSLGSHVDTQVYFDAGGGSWYRSASYLAGWQAWREYITSANIGSQSVSFATTAGSITGQANSATITAATAATANTIVLRDGSGDIYSRYSFSSYVNTSDNDESGITRFVIKNGDNYHRSATTTVAADIIRGVASGTWGINVTGNAATATNVAYSGLTGTVPTWNQNTTGNAATATEVVRTVAAGSEANLVSATIGDNDFFRIRTGGASNAGFAEIATADDGNEPIYVRQYTGTFTSLTRTATLLDGSGNTSFPGNISAANLSGTNTGDQTNISGSATSLNSNNFIERNGETNYNTSFEATPSGTARYIGDVANGANSPGNTWWVVQNFRHGNASNFWGTQVAWGWEDNANRLATRNVTNGSYGAWVYYLNSANYNSYAPALGGAGAFGTWEISIVGNAGSVTNGVYTTGNQTIDGVKTFSSTVVANRYAGVNSLILNNYTTVNPSSNVFLYSQPNDRDAWIFLDSADTGSNWGLYHRQIDSAVGGLPGNSIGFIGGGASTLQAYISLANGDAYFRGTTTIGGNISAANLSGTNTGDQTNISGNAATSNRVVKADEGNLNTAFTNTPAGQLSWTEAFNQTNAPTANTYYNTISMRHSNPSNVYGNQLSIQWVGAEPNMYLRVVNDNNFGTWRAVLTDFNYNSYALPISGGVNMTGAFGLNDNKLYLRTNGDNNHYIWNSDDDWEEIVAWQGTGLRIKSTTGATLATFSTSGNSMNITGDAATVGGYAASQLWRSDGGVWNPGANITLNQSANNQEWSFDITRNGFTGGYWHVWDSSLSSMLLVDATSGKVSAPYNFVGNLEGNSSTVGGYAVSVAGTANTIPTRNANGYLIPENWIQLNGIYGLYSPTNNAHLRPNSGTYGPWLITGSRNAWSGIEFDGLSNGNVVMMIGTASQTVGWHNNNAGWQFLWEAGSAFVSTNAFGGGTLYTVLHTGNYDLFAPTLTGGGASGTWGISITGNAATASSVAWTNVSGRPTALSAFTNDTGFISNSSDAFPSIDRANFIVTLTAAEYSALSPKQPDTLYVVV